MPSSTTTYGFPYPLLGDPADIEQAVKPLADRQEAVLQAVTATWYETKTWTLPGPVKVASGVSNFLMGERHRQLSPNHTARVVSGYGELWNGPPGTWFTWYLNRRPWGGQELTPSGWAGLNVPSSGLDSNGSEFAPSIITLVDKDRIRVGISAISGTPANGSITLTIEHKITGLVLP